MIAMQYSFSLPADYDMDIIERRIRDNGARLDGFPGLLFKAYLYARRDDPHQPSNENLYAPLYVWRDAHSMQRFLCSAGFAALTQAFGWPTIATWLISSTPTGNEVKRHVMAQRLITPVAPHSSLEKTLPTATESSSALHAWNPASWQRLDITFGSMDNAMAHTSTSIQHYRIGYTALGEGITA